MVTASKQVISNYTSPWDGDKITISRIGSSHVVEIEVSGKLKDRKKADSTPPPSKQLKLKKEERVELIKQMILEKKSREAIKKNLYDKDIYKGNPNPASAFAGDWKAANQ